MSATWLQFTLFPPVLSASWSARASLDTIRPAATRGDGAARAIVEAELRTSAQLSSDPAARGASEIQLPEALAARLRKRFKLIVFDLDRTAIPGVMGFGATLERETDELLLEVSDFGVHLAAVTGAALPEAELSFLAHLSQRDPAGGRFYLGTSSGGYTVELDVNSDYLLEDWILHEPIGDAAFVASIRAIMQEAIREVGTRLTGDAEGNAIDLEQLLTLEPAAQSPLGAFVKQAAFAASDLPPGTMLQVRDAVARRFDQSERYAGIQVVDVTHGVETFRANKGMVVRALIDRLGLDPEDVLVIGDAPIDDAMYRAASGITALHVGEAYVNMPAHPLMAPTLGPPSFRAALRLVLEAYGAASSRSLASEPDDPNEASQIPPPDRAGATLAGQLIGIPSAASETVHMIRGLDETSRHP